MPIDHRRLATLISGHNDSRVQLIDFHIKECKHLVSNSIRRRFPQKHLEPDLEVYHDTIID